MASSAFRVPSPVDGVPITRGTSIPTVELRFRFSRSGGPGGQNVNRRETQVELLFDVEGSPSLGPRQRERVKRRLANRIDDDGRLRLVSSTARTQGQNRELAIERFRELLADALRPDPPKRRPTKPSAAARERRLAGKRRRSDVKRGRARASIED